MRGTNIITLVLGQCLVLVTFISGDSLVSVHADLYNTGHIVFQRA